MSGKIWLDQQKLGMLSNRNEMIKKVGSFKEANLPDAQFICISYLL